MSDKPKVVIAGASGFVGKWLLDRYKDKWNIIALSRSKVVEPDPKIDWRTTNLFSLRSVSQALHGADYAIYLIHSMAPSTQLHQATFEDTDLFLADNFGRAAALCDIKQICYLGGILPKDQKSWSSHLRSRYEVEKALCDYGVPVTTLRAGIVIGPNGSSFQILEKLVKRLPVLICPRWTRNETEAIDLDTITDAFGAILGNEKVFDKQIELGSKEKITYLNLLKTTANALGKKRLYFPFPVNILNLSKFWLSIITGASQELAGPLVDSLKHSMKADPESDRLIRDKIEYKSLQESIESAVNTKYEPKLPKREESPITKNTVRSMQRFVNPENRDAAWVSKEYQNWLPGYFRSVIRVKADKHSNFSFYALGIPWPILKLKYMEERSSDSRQLFMINGGMLARSIDMDTGFMEFRTVLNKKNILTAIHEFIPRLPWFIYTKTQAVAHLFVMRQFGKYLVKVNASPDVELEGETKLPTTEQEVAQPK